MMQTDLEVMLPVAAWLRGRAAGLEGAIALGQQDKAAAILGALAAVFNPRSPVLPSIVSAVWGYEERLADEAWSSDAATQIVAMVAPAINRALAISAQGTN